jgi:hypothetical protein
VAGEARVIFMVQLEVQRSFLQPPGRLFWGFAHGIPEGQEKAVPDGRPLFGLDLEEFEAEYPGKGPAKAPDGADKGLALFWLLHSVIGESQHLEFLVIWSCSQ